MFGRIVDRIACEATIVMEVVSLSSLSHPDSNYCWGVRSCLSISRSPHDKKAELICELIATSWSLANEAGEPQGTAGECVP